MPVYIACTISNDDIAILSDTCYTVGSRHLDFANLEQPLISKWKSSPFLNTKIK